MSEENQSSFKISDRRLFNADGSLRGDAVIDELPADQEKAVAPAPATSLAEELAVPPISTDPGRGPDWAVDGGAEDSAEPTLFTEFLMQVASSAFIYLGLVEHPQTGRPQVNLDAARETIDLLDMLRDKTRGNLTRGEDKLFEDLMADLKMQFVARRR